MTVKWQDYIEERRDVMLGKPVFKGTRLTVEQVLRDLGTGISHEELLRNYPTAQSRTSSGRHPICGGYNGYRLFTRKTAKSSSN